MDGIFRLNELLSKFSFSSETENGSNNQRWSPPLSANSHTFQVGEFLQLHNMPKQIPNLNATSAAPHSAELKAVAEDATGVTHLSAIEDGNDELDNVPSTSTCARFSQRRCNPMRAAKESTPLKIKRRSIVKPSRRYSSDITRPEDIKKLYTQKKLGSFRPSSLETIFEEPQSNGRGGFIDPNQVQLVGIKKIRRSLSCSDGTNTKKMVAKRRHNKVKKLFGKRLTSLNKWSLNDLMTRLYSESKVEDSNGVTGNDYDSCLSEDDIISTDALSMGSVMGDAMDEDRGLSSNFDTLSMISMHQCSAANEDNERNLERASRLARGLAKTEE